MPEKHALAKYLKEYRKAYNVTQPDFAEKIGISIEELSLLEREKGNPGLNTLQKIAAYTGDTVSDLLEWKTGVKKVEFMHKQLLEMYFDSEGYRFGEKNRIYRQLTEKMQECMDALDYLEVEEILHEALIDTVERSFLAGCKAAVKHT